MLRSKHDKDRHCFEPFSAERDEQLTLHGLCEASILLAQCNKLKVDSLLVLAKAFQSSGVSSDESSIFAVANRLSRLAECHVDCAGKRHSHPLRTSSYLAQFLVRRGDPGVQLRALLLQTGDVVHGGLQQAVYVAVVSVPATPRTDHVPRGHLPLGRERVWARSPHFLIFRPGPADVEDTAVTCAGHCNGSQSCTQPHSPLLALKCGLSPAATG